MVELHSDRRQQPRFPATGTFQLEFSGAGNLHGKVFELSLSGALLERPPGSIWGPGERHCISLQFPEQPPFTAEALVVHANAHRIGIEFYDMEPQSFTTLTRLIANLPGKH